MLKIIGADSAGVPEIEFGDYLPFKLQFPTDVGFPHLYWRAGNFIDRLIELQIDSQDGRVLAVALVLPGKVAEGLPAFVLPTNSFDGVPVSTTKGWPENRLIDDVQDFEVFVDGSRIFVLFDSAEAVLRIASSNISFGVGESGGLVWVLINTSEAKKLLELN